MKVILNQTVPKVGKAGSVVKVADGFARNYLFPRGLAIVADKKQLQVLERRNAKIEAQTAGEKARAADISERVAGKTIRIEGKVGAAQGKLFGAITAQHVADAIQEQLGETLDRKVVALIEPIKQLGRHEIELDLHRSVDTKIWLEVFDPAAPVAAQEDATEEQPAEEPVVEEAPIATPAEV